MPNFQDLAERYIAVWNETDPALRQRAVQELWAPDARYSDPMTDVQGHDAIDQTIGAVQGQFPGLRFRLAGTVDAHHDQARFSWELGPEDAEAAIVGFDVVVLDDAERFQTVLGFLDKVPTA